MGECSFSCDPFLRIDFEHLLEQIHNNRINFIVLFSFERESTVFILFMDLIVGLALEDTPSEEEEVENQS